MDNKLIENDEKIRIPRVGDSPGTPCYPNYNPSPNFYASNQKSDTKHNGCMCSHDYGVLGVGCKCFIPINYLWGITCNPDGSFTYE